MWEERGDSSDCKSHTHLATFPSFDPFFLASGDRVKGKTRKSIDTRESERKKHIPRPDFLSDATSPKDAHRFVEIVWEI